ncbi:MAG: hypothetical protein HC837_06915 [Chloroflexaceae bacterium]|nr:hypothetical protein [Chloroflexaceae bacterium]
MVQTGWRPQPPLRGALQRAFHGAVKQVRQEWEYSQEYEQIYRDNRETAKITVQSLEWIIAHTDDIFNSDDLEQQLNDQQQKLIAMVQNQPDAADLPGQLLKPVLDEYLKRRPPVFRDFVERRLIDSWLLRLRETLKNDEDARTAYEQLWHGSMNVALQRIEQQTSRTQQDIEGLLMMVDSLQQRLQQPDLPPAVVSADALVAALQREVRPYLDRLLDEIRAVKRDTERILTELAALKAAQWEQLDPAVREDYRKKELELATALLAQLPTDALPDPSPGLPAGSLMLHHRNDYFVGRHADLLALARALKGEQSTMAVSQTGGSHGPGRHGQNQPGSRVCPSLRAVFCRRRLLGLLCGPEGY